MLLTVINAFCTLTAMQSAQWYSWGPPNMQCRLCVSCWMYWKKYGGLKMPSRAEGPEERTSPSPASNVSSVRICFKSPNLMVLKDYRKKQVPKHGDPQNCSSVVQVLLWAINYSVSSKRLILYLAYSLVIDSHGWIFFSCGEKWPVKRLFLHVYSWQWDAKFTLYLIVTGIKSCHTVVYPF